MTDEQLALRARDGDEESFAELVRRHRMMLRALASRRYAFGHGADDIDQEAQIALFAAACSFNPARGVPFGAFAHLVVTRRLDTFVTGANRAKHRPLNERYSFERVDVAGEVGAEDALLSLEPGPHELLIQREQRGKILAAFERLTEIEREAIIGRANGESMLQVEERLGLDRRADGRPKSVDNALQRARLKFLRALREDDRSPLGVAA